ncbi:chlororespiratory reduction protein 7 [Synechococcales cyanobacterium C]|uniref:Chlororespiratory reduction protein 7 n=1 Tax=Petrachloros mirabilis ULC683 TaxID=2781853 RepID=A0A8K2A979_9CYAN|nr:chlororespiratory reduction protein 7 [Petrachloros mirabilis]NCJ07730.1 chlororespiratory reduction protein 7 [Petrachloros mirabilis ULC683]
MPDSLMYSDTEMFVVLESQQPEQFLTPQELLAKLVQMLEPMQDELPPDLQLLATAMDQAQHLMQTSCELNLGPNQFLQWYAVRLEK